MNNVSEWLMPTNNAYLWAERVSKVSGVPVDAIYERNRRPEICRARHLLWATLRAEGWSLVRIGKETGYDHTAVLHGVRKVPSEVVEEFRGNFI